MLNGEASHKHQEKGASRPRTRVLQTLVAFVREGVVTRAVDDQHHLDDGEHQREADDDQREDGRRERLVPVRHQHAQQEPDDHDVRREVVTTGAVEVEILDGEVDNQVDGENGQTDRRGADVIQPRLGAQHHVEVLQGDQTQPPRVEADAVLHDADVEDDVTVEAALEEVEVGALQVDEREDDGEAGGQTSQQREQQREVATPKTVRNRETCGRNKSHKTLQFIHKEITK